MAVNQIPLSPSNSQCQALLALINQLKGYRQQQGTVRYASLAALAKIAAMIDGSTYTQETSQLGLQSDAQSQTLFNELNSTASKLSDPTQTQAAVEAAIDQFIAWVG